MRVKYWGLVKRLGMLLVSAFLAGLFLFLCLYLSGQVVSERYMEISSYFEKRANKRIENFQNYILKKGALATDVNIISEWGKKNSIVLMEIYRGHFLLYSTVAPDYFYAYENTEEATLYEWATYHTVVFADGEAQVLVYADDVTAWNYGLLVMSAISGFIFFMIIFLLGCNRIVQKICMLNERIQMMEAGNLNVEIPTDGNRHELDQLTNSLNAMRCAFKEQLEREMSVFFAHQTMITKMSHDLRTPLTTLQIYTDILRYKPLDLNMREYYLKLIDAKVFQIKQLADHIVEYSLVPKQEEVMLESPVPERQVVHDLLSETEKEYFGRRS